MKKKLLVLVAMLLCVVTVLASCTSSIGFAKVVGDGTYNDENPTLTTAALTTLKGDNVMADGDLVVFLEVNSNNNFKTYTVYNVATGTVVSGAGFADSLNVVGNVTSTITNSISIKKQWDTTWFVVTTTNTKVTATDDGPKTDVSATVSLRDANGAEFATATDISNFNIEQVEDLIVYNEKAYRIAEDGTIAHAFDFSAMRKMPTLDKKVGDYYVGKNVYNGTAIYDESLNLIANLNLPSYKSQSALMSDAKLSNGNCLIQFSVAADLMTEDYTYSMESGSMMAKYDLYSYLIDAKSGKVKELDLDFIVDAVDYKDCDDVNWAYDEKIDNVAWIYYIEDQHVDKSDAACVMVSLSNNGKIKSEINDLVVDMDCKKGITFVANNRWIVSNKLGQKFLLNEKGDVLGEVSAVSDTDNANYFIFNSKIYDWDLNVKYDLYENDATVMKEMNHSVLMTNADNEVLLYANGEVKKLIDKNTAELGKRELTVISEALYAIKDTSVDGKTKYEFYNDAGTLLQTIDTATFVLGGCIVATADSNNAVLIRGMSVPADGQTAKVVYYRVG